MRTGAQVYQGLAGLLLVSDQDEDALALPSGEAELLCVLQDRRFDARNQLVYQGGGMMEMMNGFLGDRVLVSGRLQPTTEVDAGWHRVRLLNGSNARIYKLAWSRDLPMTVIGGDGGLLEHPVDQRALTLAPGQRADVLLDLTGLAPGTDVHLDSLPFPAADAGGVGMMMGNPVPVSNGAPMRLMTLRTRARTGPAFEVPERLPSFDASWSAGADARFRRVPLGFQRMQWTLAGRTFSMDEVAADETVRAQVTFTSHPGLYLYHCHILEHEDMGMMRNFRVT